MEEEDPHDGVINAQTISNTKKEMSRKCHLQKVLVVARCLLKSYKEIKM